MDTLWFVAFRSRTGRRSELDRPPRPVIVANPSGDPPFRAMIDAFLLSAGSRPEDLEVALRTRYPLAVVRPRGLAGERVEVWYVYRDGHWIRSEDDGAV